MSTDVAFTQSLRITSDPVSSYLAQLSPLFPKNHWGPPGLGPGWDQFVYTVVCRAAGDLLDGQHWGVQVEQREVVFHLSRLGWEPGHQGTDDKGEVADRAETQSRQCNRSLTGRRLVMRWTMAMGGKEPEMPTVFYSKHLRPAGPSPKWLMCPYLKETHLSPSSFLQHTHLLQVWHLGITGGDGGRIKSNCLE